MAFPSLSVRALPVPETKSKTTSQYKHYGILSSNPTTGLKHNLWLFLFRKKLASSLMCREVTVRRCDHSQTLVSSLDSMTRLILDQVGPALWAAVSKGHRLGRLRSPVPVAHFEREDLPPERRTSFQSWKSIITSDTRFLRAGAATLHWDPTRCPLPSNLMRSITHVYDRSSML